MVRISTSFLFLLISQFCQTQHLSQPLTVSPNQRYTTTGSFSVDTTSTYANSSASAWNPTNYITIYSIGGGYSPQVLVFVCIKDLYLSLSSKQIQFYFRYSVYSSAFFLSLYSNLTSKIQTLTFNYLVFANEYISNYNIASYQSSKNISNYISASSSRTIGLYLS